MSESIEEPRAKFEFGPYVPIIKTGDDIIIDPHGVVDYYQLSKQTEICRSLLGEILPEDSIVDSPSLVTPLLLKKKTTWPRKIPAQSKEQSSPHKGATHSSSDDVQVIKVVSRGSESPDNIIENNPRYRRVEDYIKETVVANLTKSTRPPDSDQILATEDYYKSASSDLLVSIGLSRVTEFNTGDQIRRIVHKLRKGTSEHSDDLESLKLNLIETRKFNAPYKSSKLLRCSHCDFKTDSVLVLESHLEFPHKSPSRLFSCNWCNFKTKDSSQIIVHNFLVHKKYRCRIEQSLANHCCRYCPFESNSKRSFTSHILRCEQSFQEDLVQAPADQYDYPGVTSKCITQQDVRTYESTLKAFRLAAYNPHQIKVSSSALEFNNQSILVLPRKASLPPKPKSNSVQVIPISKLASPYSDVTSIISGGSSRSDKTSKPAHDLQNNSSHLMRLLSANSTAGNISRKNTGLLQHPRPQSVFVNGLAVIKNAQGIVMKPQNSTENKQTTVIDLTMDSDQPSDPQAPRDTFVICEICDSYIENLCLFKSHMQWVHKIKIHQKLQRSTRPPLCCQKCNYRFFTDEGLDRHLLGSHSLITTNMQELADNEKDSGRCTVCGVRCPCKLVSHMRDVHKSNLKPAQLCYKCTVCSANFSLYRNFENHVYRIHTNPIK